MTTAPLSARFIPNPTPCGRLRRQFLWEVGGGFAGLGHSGIVSFTPLAGAALLLLFGLVWFVPNSMEMLWRHDPALPSPYPDQPVTPARRFFWRPTRLQAALYGVLCIVAVLALSNLKPFIYFQF